MLAQILQEARNNTSATLRKSWDLKTTVLIGSSIFSNPGYGTFQDLRPKTRDFPSEINLLTATIQDLQAFLTKGSVNSVQLTKECLVRISANNYAGLKLRAVLETAPYDSVIEITQYYDDLRASGTVLSELHGIPLLFKDNIATDVELGMNTTAGSYALLNSIVAGDATVTSKLRGKGAIVLGKASLTELSGFKSSKMENGFSRGGQCQSAYIEGSEGSSSPSRTEEGPFEGAEKPTIPGL